MSSGGLQLLQSVCPGVSLSILHGKLMATVSDLYIRFDPKTQDYKSEASRQGSIPTIRLLARQVCSVRTYLLVSTPWVSRVVGICSA